MKFTPASASVKLALCALAFSAPITASAQAAAAPSAPAQGQGGDKERPHYVDTRPIKTFHLKNAAAPNDGNEILTGLRLMLDASTKLYLVPSRNEIVVRGTPDDLALAEKLVDEFDTAAKLFRITYTVTESDSGKRVGVQHFAMVVTAGQKTVLKDGSRVPVATGSYGATAGSDHPSGVQTQFTYLDVGMNFDASLAIDGQTLQSKVEQSSSAEGKSISGVDEPIIRQAIVTGTTILTPGKPQNLGSLDVPGSTRHLDIEVLLEPVK